METTKTIVHIDCIHEESWVNLGLRGCSLGKDPTRCDTCEFKQGEDVEITTTSCSIT